MIGVDFSTFIKSGYFYFRFYEFTVLSTLAFILLANKNAHIIHT